ATDNNAAALASCEHNLQQLKALRPKLETGVSAADCADRIEQRFDLIVCNPPFHQGFNVDNSLTDKFLNAAKNHLNQNGQAYFVVNSFIGIEKKAQQIFKRVETLANNKQFKVLRFS
ncbi:MAG: class I SAM-dependent methyltransferase, partial [Cellvibrionaceae bacterium]|nr:class I SAM-dependent methyltransferase [Cellvibrionaceae bacterium]